MTDTTTLAIAPRSGVIIGAMNHAKHRHDSYVMAEVSEQIESITGAKPCEMVGDHGYRDADEQAKLLVDGIRVITPADRKRATKGTAEYRSLRRKLKLRSRIGAVIGHLKSDHCLGRNCLRGCLGDEQNVLLAAVGWNNKKQIRFFSDLPQGQA